MKISVFGLGYVGSVTAACFADYGHQVWGVDINKNKVEMINNGQPPVFESGLKEKLARVLKAGTLKATADSKKALSESDLSFVIVATPSEASGKIDPSHLYRACEQIADTLVELGRKQIVVIRSSVLPNIFKGCEAIFADRAPGLVELCTNPEFLREGSAISDFESPPFTIIGTTHSRVESALREVYEDVESPIYILDPLEATMIKYASNVFHGLKVAFANEIGALCRAQGIDSHAVMRTFIQDSKLNISGRYLQPGYAFGGSCLPKDIRAVMSAGNDFDIPLPVISSIIPSNTSVIDRALSEVLNKNKSNVGLMGLSFKTNTDDLRESALLELALRLDEKEGINLKIYDSFVSDSIKTDLGLSTAKTYMPKIQHFLVDNLDQFLDHSDTLIIGHVYPEFHAMIDRINPDTSIIDLAYLPSLRKVGSAYNGINW